MFAYLFLGAFSFLLGTLILLLVWDSAEFHFRPLNPGAIIILVLIGGSWALAISAFFGAWHAWRLR